MKKLVLKSAAPISFMAFVVLALMPVQAHAASLLGTVSLDAGCVSKVNGAKSSTQTVKSGEDVNITVNNDDTVVSQNVSGPGVPAGAQLGPNNRSSTTSNKTFILGAVSSPVTITFTPVPSSYNDVVYTNNCPEGSSPQPSTITINPEAPAPSNTKTTTPSTTKPKTSISTPSSTSAPDQQPAANSENSTSSNDSATQAEDTAADTTKQASQTLKLVLGLLAVLVIAFIVLGATGHLPVVKKVVPGAFTKKRSKTAKKSRRKLQRRKTSRR